MYSFEAFCIYDRNEILNRMEEERGKIPKIYPEAVGENVKEYEEKLKWLKEKWNDEDDNHEVRLISHIYHTISALNQAVIADNVSYFKEHLYKYYKKGDSYLHELLATACLCGSKQVAEFLLKEFNEDYFSKGNDFILGYVVASPNLEWAEEIATKLAKSGRSMPGDVIVYANMSTMDKLEEIFNTNKEMKNKENADSEKSEVSEDGKARIQRNSR